MAIFELLSQSVLSLLLHIGSLTFFQQYVFLVYIFSNMVSNGLHNEVRVRLQGKLLEAHVYIGVHLFKVFEFLAHKEVIILSPGLNLKFLVGLDGAHDGRSFDFLLHFVFFILYLQLVR